jgi:hypothetical protein
MTGRARGGIVGAALMMTSAVLEGAHAQSVTGVLHSLLMPTTVSLASK